MISPEAVRLLRSAKEFEQAGRLQEATWALEMALAAAPDLASSWFNLGVLQRRLHQYERALDSYAQALARGVSQPEEVHLNRAVIYTDHLRQDVAAERELRSALELNPAYLPALLNLANLHEDLGREAEALATYEQLLKLSPTCFEALARYAALKPVSGAQDPLVTRLRSALANPAARWADQASLGFALGKVLDGCGEYAAAFDAYRAANQASRQSAVPPPHYDRSAQEALVDQLIATFNASPAYENALGQLPTGAIEPVPQPIFICGMFRSGSTVAERVLAGHPEITAGGELDLLPRLINSGLQPFPACMSKVPGARLAQIGRAYLEDLARLYPQAHWVTDKRPDNFLYIGLIKRLFPRARIVHTVRDPLDTCLSVYFLHLHQGMAYALDLLDTGHYYRQYARLMAHWRRLYGASIVEFNYDDFVRQPRAVAERLLLQLGLEWDERCLQVERSGGGVKSASNWQARRPIYQSSSGRSSHYHTQLAALRHFLAS